MGADLARDVLGFVREQRELMIDLLHEFVRAESPSKNPESHQLMRSVFKAHMGRLEFDAFEVGVSNGVRHIYARPINRVKGEPLQLLLGHMDTVWPLGTLAKLPFTVEGNIVRGPGVFDMKGGLAQIIIALETIRFLGRRTPLTPIVFINADEEIGSRSSTNHIRRFARRVERAFVLEPALGDQGRLKTERKGIGRFTVTAFGKAAHAGLDPASGASAILELSHVIQKLHLLNDVDNGVTVNVGTVDGGVQPNVVAPYSKAVIDVRVPTHADGECIEKAIHSIQPHTPGVRLSIEGRIGRPPMEKTSRNQALWLRAQQLGGELGLKLQAGAVGGGSDGNTTSQFTATLDGLGPVGDGAHAEHEHLRIDESLDRAALLAMLLLSPSVSKEQQGDDA